MTYKIKIGIFLTAVFGMAFISADKDKYFEIAKNLEIYANVYKEINTNYVDDVDPAQLMRTGIDAMLASLDPFTNYISESQIEFYRINTEGQYNGFGSIVRKIDDYVTIIEAYEESPATKAGLIVGDQIISVNGRSTKGKSVDEVGQMVRGASGTDIQFLIQRPGTDKELEYILTRDQIVVPNVPYSAMVSDGVGYISLTTFTQNAGSNVRKAFRALKDENPDLKGIVLDLRFNGGGLLSEAVNVSNVFIPKGELVATTKGKVIDRDQSFRTRLQPVDLEIPVVVLVNKRSASASEIVSGVLQDYDRAVIMGQRTYGKGLVQRTWDVGYNSKVKITTSKYYIPSGRCIQSVEYSDGEPKDLPDEKRAKFKTRNGRTVLDGGGVTPDVLIEKPEPVPFIANLTSQNMIFKYCNEYYLKNNQIDSIGEFNFDDIKNFNQFLEGNDFTFTSKSEKRIEEIKEGAKKEQLLEGIEDELNQVLKTIQKEKEDDLTEFQEEVIDMLEEEIVGRYFFKKGKIQQSLLNDNELQQAIELINNPQEYQAILTNL